MKSMDKTKILRIIGITGTVASIVIYALKPSFPTPDKILIFLVYNAQNIDMW